MTGLVIAMLAVALIGFADATFLTIKHYNGSELVCGPSGGCNTVTKSPYSLLFGIPVALLGSIYYVSVLLVAIEFLDSRKKIFAEFLMWAPIAGLAASAWFVYAQLAIIKAICVYCMGSAITSSILFILGMTLLYSNKKRDE